MITALLLTALVAAQPVSTWRPADPQNILVLDTDGGRVYVELHPEVAPNSVERVKLLTRRGTYDGLQFWRSVPGFVVQADVGNAEGGKTELPNLKAEFAFRLKPDMPHTVVAQPAGIEEGFIGGLPYNAIGTDAHPQRPDGSRRAWASHCTGVMGMGRDEGNDTANAEIYLMTGPYPGLNLAYTGIGQVLIGENLLQAMPAGEPASHPAILKSAHILADLPDAPKIEVMDTQSPAFTAIVKAARKARGADFSVCDVTVPARAIP